MNSEIYSWAIFAGPLVLAALLILKLGRLRGRKETRVKLSKYSVKESVLTLAETRFLGVLNEVVGTKYRIMVKPRMLDLFEISGGEGYQAAMNRISQKHVDFLLCEPVTYEPVLALELDDRSHQRKDRMERDAFVESLYEETGMNLLRLPARTIKAEELAAQIISVLKSNGSR